MTCPILTEMPYRLTYLPHPAANADCGVAPSPVRYWLATYLATLTMRARPTRRNSRVRAACAVWPISIMGGRGRGRNDMLYALLPRDARAVCHPTNIVRTYDLLDVIIVRLTSGQPCALSSAEHVARADIAILLRNVLVRVFADCSIRRHWSAHLSIAAGQALHGFSHQCLLRYLKEIIPQRPTPYPRSQRTDQICSTEKT